MRRLGLPISRELLGVALMGLLLAGCAGSGPDGPVPASSSPVPSSAAGSSEVASPASDDLPDFGHIKATSSEEVLDALSDSGLKCDWTAALDPDPASDDVVNKCAKWGAYLWFSATGTSTGFVDAARGDPKLKGYMYMTGDHWVMIAKPKIILEMSRSVGGDAGKF